MAALREIVVDSVEPPLLARFWAEALDGYSVRPYDEAEIARLAEMGFTPETDPQVAIDGAGPTIFFQKTNQKKTQRNRIHFDVSSLSRTTEVKRLLDLGAKIRDEHDGFTVMLDPEGNEFCVVDAKETERRPSEGPAAKA